MVVRKCVAAPPVTKVRMVSKTSQIRCVYKLSHRANIDHGCDAGTWADAGSTCLKPRHVSATRAHVHTTIAQTIALHSTTSRGNLAHTQAPTKVKRPRRIKNLHRRHARQHLRIQLAAMATNWVNVDAISLEIQLARHVTSLK